MRTQVLLQVRVDGRVGGGPPELAVVPALWQHRAGGLVREAARDAKVDRAPVARGRCAGALLTQGQSLVGRG